MRVYFKFYGFLNVIPNGGREKELSDVQCAYFESK